MEPTPDQTWQDSSGSIIGEEDGRRDPSAFIVTIALKSWMIPGFLVVHFQQIGSQGTRKGPVYNP